MTNSTIVELFGKYGLGSQVTALCNFKTVMAAVGVWHQSVWELKRFARLSDPEPSRAVIVDYGFMNCQTPQERTHLRRMYADFFSRGGDEMDLHQACIDGRLAQFLESRMGRLPVSAELLASPYPLDGCSYMGMVSESVALCPESASHVVGEMHRAMGERRLILTIPDECDAEMVACLQDRAAFLTGKMSITTTEFRGRTVRSMSD
jgi:hypothetical protein